MPKFLILLLVSLLVQSSNVTTISDITPSTSTSAGAVYSNDSIPEKISAEIDSLNQEFMEDIIKQNKDNIENSLYPKEAYLFDVNDTMSSYKEIIADDTAYSILDEYYFVVQADGTSSNSMAVSDDGEYIVYTAALDGEIYISFLLIEKQYYTLLLTIERVREDENWGIRTLYINDYSYYQMNAAGFYETAKVLSDKGHTLSAFLYMYVLRSNILRPSPLMQYSSENEMLEFAQSLQDEILENNSFPIEFDDLEKVVLYNIDVKIVDGGLMPDFMYVTGYNLSDTSEENLKSIEEEAYKLHEKMRALFPGIDEDFSKILYGAAAEIPENSNIQYQRYGTVIDTN